MDKPKIEEQKVEEHKIETPAKEEQVVQPAEENPKKVFLSKKLLLPAIGILVVLIGLATVLIIAKSQKQTPATTSKETEQKIVKKSPSIYLDPATVTTKATQTDYSTTVMVNSQDIEADGVAIEVEYDPSTLSSLKIVPSSDADLNIGGAIKIETSDSNPKVGRASLVIRKDSKQKLSPQKIAGRVAMIYFTVNKKATLPTTITLTKSSEFITLDAKPTNPNLTNLTIEFGTTLAPNAQDRLKEQSKL